MEQHPNRLPLTCITAGHFTWSGQTGVAEESDLPEHLVSRVYRDACDFGFLVQSDRTGRTVLFTCSEILRGSEGERVGSRFCDAEDLGLTIDILND